MSEPKGLKRFWHAAAALNNGTALDLRAPNSATSTVYVTKLTLSITTHAAGKLFQLQDSTGTPVVFAKHLDAAAAAGVLSVVTWDFGQQGIPMSLGKKAQAVSEASGIAGWVYAEGYDVVPLP